MTSTQKYILEIWSFYRNILTYVDKQWFILPICYAYINCRLFLVIVSQITL